MSGIYDPQDQQPPRHGLILLQVFIVVLFAIFTLRFWFLQIHKGDEYAEKARANQLRQEEVYAPRGLISDVNGQLVTVNEPAYALGLVREDCQDIEKTLQQVSEWTGVPLETLKAVLKKKRRKVKPFEPLILVSNLSFDQLAFIESNSLHWPGLEIVVRPRRKYNNGELLAHVLGYVAEASEKDLNNDPTLSLGDNVGRQGLELTKERRLRGVKGLRQFEVDVNGRRLAEKEVRPPRAGENLRLSIDLGLQKKLTAMLKDKEASVLIMDADTGKFVAFVSSPSYDSNVFAGGLSSKEWIKLRDNPRHPMQNRAIQSVYPPGSVFKLAMAGAGLHDNAINTSDTVFCGGSTKLGNHVFRCWRKNGHGTVDLEKALVQSCDVYFYKLGQKLGVDRMEHYARNFGFGSKTGIELPHEKSGFVPSKAWKKRRFGERWQKGEDLNLSIGQGYLLVSPIQVVRFVAALVNGGILYQPQLVADGLPKEQARIALTPREREIIISAMIETVNSPRGTCRRIRTKNVVAGAKTGTAQVVRLTDELKAMKDHEIPYKFRDHAWMAGFAEQGDKKYAMVAMVEHGLHGGSGAGPLLKEAIHYLFPKQPTVKKDKK
ncbi:MAG: penicillin-binding protein 2 [Desulfovibrio sp.]